jgi:hypothetical protein
MLANSSKARSLGNVEARDSSLYGTSLGLSVCGPVTFNRSIFLTEDEAGAVSIVMVSRAAQMHCDDGNLAVNRARCGAGSEDLHPDRRPIKIRHHRFCVEVSVTIKSDPLIWAR